MAIIRGTPNGDTVTPLVVSAGVAVINLPPGFPFGGDTDLILALGGDDVIAGGLGNDTAFLGDGDDRFTWDPGEGSDVVRGGRGTDTLEFNGSDATETFTISDGANLDVDLFRDVGNILMELKSVERIELNALGGDDVIDASALTVPTELVVNGGTGSDSATLGAGDDRFIWNPGDGDDVVDGRDGVDTLEFNGSSADEEFVISDLPDDRVELFRDAGSIEMDLTSVERIELNGLDGNDLVDASALTRDVELIVDGGGGDDTVIAGPGDDTISGGAGSDIMFGNGGADTFAFGAETGDGILDFDAILDYNQADGDVIDLSQSGGLVSSAPVDDGLTLTLGGGDADQLFIANVDSFTDVTVVT